MRLRVRLRAESEDKTGRLPGTMEFRRRCCCVGELSRRGQLATSFAAAVGPPNGADGAGPSSTAAHALQPKIITQFHLFAG